MYTVYKNKKLDYSKLSDQVYRVLADKIVRQKIPAGTKLVEEGLAGDLGVSRTPVREALNRLAQDGLVTLIPRKGAKINRLKTRDIEEIYDLRRALEGLAAEKATPLMKKTDLCQISKMLDVYESAAARNKLDVFLKSDLKLHSLLLARSGNLRLVKTIANLANFVNSFRSFDARQYEQRAVQAHAEHKKILKALIKKDAGLARSLLEQHIENAKRNILADFVTKIRVKKNKGGSRKRAAGQ